MRSLRRFHPFTHTLIAAGLAVAVVLAALGVAALYAPHRVPHAALLRSTAVPVMTITMAQSPATTASRPPKRASRSGVGRTAVRPASVAPVVDDAFWWRLSHGCECSGGSGCAGSGGWFQFKGGTARQVGYFIGATYDQQLAMAKSWLAQIGGRGGTRAGWPVCWWFAARG